MVAVVVPGVLSSEAIILVQRIKDMDLYESMDRCKSLIDSMRFELTDVDGDYSGAASACSTSGSMSC